MASYIVSRKVVEGWRGNKNDPRNKTPKASNQVPEGDDLLAEETLPTKSHRKVGQSLKESIHWMPTQGGRFTLDCVRALETIEKKMFTFTEFNRELYANFSKVLKQLIEEERQERFPEFIITATGYLPDNNRMGRFIRIERNGKRCALPEGFRSLCRFAIQRKFNPRSNEFLFPGKKPRRNVD